MKIYITMALVVALAGCQATKEVADSIKTDVSALKTKLAERKKKKGLPVHGEFCGPKVPDIDEEIKGSRRVARLRAITPIDYIDKACKTHDVCYIENGYFNQTCDKQLVSSISKYYFSPQCTGLALRINSYFGVSYKTDDDSNSFDNVMNMITSVVKAPSTLMSNLTGDAKSSITYLRGKKFSRLKRYDKCNPVAVNNFEKAQRCHPKRKLNVFTSTIEIKETTGNVDNNHPVIHDGSGLYFIGNCWREGKDKNSPCLRKCY